MKMNSCWRGQNRWKKLFLHDPYSKWVCAKPAEPYVSIWQIAAPSRFALAKVMGLLAEELRQLLPGINSKDAPLYRYLQLTNRQPFIRISYRLTIYLANPKYRGDYPVIRYLA